MGVADQRVARATAREWKAHGCRAAWDRQRWEEDLVLAQGARMRLALQPIPTQNGLGRPELCNFIIPGCVLTNGWNGIEPKAPDVRSRPV